MKRVFKLKTVAIHMGSWDNEENIDEVYFSSYDKMREYVKNYLTETGSYDKIELAEIMEDFKKDSYYYCDDEIEFVGEEIAVL